ncbi:MAG: hypothetical protein M3Q38_04680, partial [Chloroflexota bacterium]|nr:hypothetical protein [Chloroflexota bacterium]
MWNRRADLALLLLTFSYGLVSASGLLLRGGTPGPDWRVHISPTAPRPTARKNDPPAQAYDPAPAGVNRKPVEDRLDSGVTRALMANQRRRPVGTPPDRFSTWRSGLAASRRG